MGEPNSELKTSRPYQERFLDGYERSQLREEVQKVKPRFSGMRRKYATWALGASLALGGLGVPMKMIHDAQGSHAVNPTESAAAADTPEQGISADMQAAKSIAGKVAGGVAAVTQGVEQATSTPLAAVTEAPKEIPKQLGLLSDQVKETFFKKEVPFGSIIYKEAKKNNLNPALVAAVVHTESKATTMSPLLSTSAATPATGAAVSGSSRIRNRSALRTQTPSGAIARPPSRPTPMSVDTWISAVAGLIRLIPLTVPTQT